MNTISVDSAANGDTPSSIPLLQDNITVRQRKWRRENGIRHVTAVETGTPTAHMLHGTNRQTAQADGSWMNTLF